MTSTGRKRKAREYEVRGTVEMNFSCVVEAESEDEAATLAESLSAEGEVDFGMPVYEGSITEVKVLPKRKKAGKS